MLEFLARDGNLPFLASLGVMIGIALLEGVGAIVGLGFSRLFDNLVPDSLSGVETDFDFDGVDADIGDVGDVAVPGTAGAGLMSSVLGWLCVGRVPILILLIWFLTAFGLLGLVLQGLVNASLGFMLPAALASVPALVIAFPSVRLFGQAFSKWVPKEQTTALSMDTFIGMVAIIVRGRARPGRPAEAKLRDRFGQTHYLLVEPDSDTGMFAEGDEVLLVRRAGKRFWGIPNQHTVLSPD